MNNKLKYDKYKNSDSVLIIDLHNGYSVITITGWNKECKTYNAVMYLKDNTIDTWMLIDETENFTINANYRTINRAVLFYVSELFNDGFFDKYINRYEYELNCISKGDEILKQEGLCD